MKRSRLGVVLAAGLAVLLAGCLVLPGKFASDLSLRRDGSFAFAYKGEIHVLALADPEKADGPEPAPTFTAEACYDEETIEERKCSAEDLADQKAKWDEAQQSAAEKKRQDAEMTKAMLGGIDPNDPKAGEELAQRLMRQEGWKSVTYRGNGVFDVDYGIAGRLDHDFAFPTIEKMPGVQPFVTVIRRNDGTVRVEGPGFGGAATSPMMTMMQGLGAKNGGTGDADKLPRASGTFDVVTDGEILANDTDQGPMTDPAGKRLHWKIDGSASSTPTALIRLGG